MSIAIQGGASRPIYGDSSGANHSKIATVNCAYNRKDHSGKGVYSPAKTPSQVAGGYPQIAPCAAEPTSFAYLARTPLV